MLLAIETSCDETAVALFELGQALEVGTPYSSVLKGEKLASQIALHEAYGGVVPELAAREHLSTLAPLVRTILQDNNLDFDSLTAIAVTSGPGLKGCLLVGYSYAKSLAYELGIPLLPVHHIEGHMFAPELDDPPQYPALALVVSGGHTMLVRVAGFRDYEVIAVTRDDAAGEAFDKSATLLGLPYPGGPALSRQAEQGDPESYSLPVGVAHDPNSFSFSGLKTAVHRCILGLGDSIEDPQVLSNVAASVQSAIVRALVEKTKIACERHSPESLILTGGVAANSYLRKRLEDELSPMGITLHVPPMKWCTDNAAMIGVVASKMYWQHQGKLNALNPRCKSQDVSAVLSSGVRARWPIEELLPI
jgi:N6-L-threonylcarbamoyladenine synthase